VVVAEHDTAQSWVRPQAVAARGAQRHPHPHAGTPTPVGRQRQASGPGGRGTAFLAGPGSMRHDRPPPRVEPDPGPPHAQTTVPKAVRWSAGPVGHDAPLGHRRSATSTVRPRRCARADRWSVRERCGNVGWGAPAAPAPEWGARVGSQELPAESTNIVLLAR
jgi:hypothetical protein